MRTAPIRLSIPALLLAAAALAALPRPAAAQQGDAEAVVREVVRRARAGAEGVRGYTVEQLVGGEPVTLAYTRERGGGWSVRAVHAPGAGAVVSLAGGDLARWLARREQFLRENARRFAYVRADTLRGRPVHVVSVEQRGADFSPPGTTPTGDARGTWWVDAERFVPLRIELSGQVIAPDGKRQPTSSVLDFSDHRPVRGMLLPHRTTLGLGASPMLPPPAMLEEMRRGIAALLERGPADEERERLEATARMLDVALERGVLELEIRVRRVRVEDGG